MPQFVFSTASRGGAGQLLQFRPRGHRPKAPSHLSRDGCSGPSLPAPRGSVHPPSRPPAGCLLCIHTTSCSHFFRASCPRGSGTSGHILADSMRPSTTGRLTWPVRGPPTLQAGAVIPKYRQASHTEDENGGTGHGEGNTPCPHAAVSRRQGNLPCRGQHSCARSGRPHTPDTERPCHRAALCGTGGTFVGLDRWAGRTDGQDFSPDTGKATGRKTSSPTALICAGYGPQTHFLQSTLAPGSP